MAGEKVKDSKTMPSWLKVIITVVLAVLAGAAVGIPIAVNVKPSEDGKEVKVELTTVIKDGDLKLSPEQVPAIVEEGDGLVEKSLPTVEEIDGGELVNEETKQKLNDVSMAHGATYDTSSWQAFVSGTTDKCVIEGNIFGAQCVSLAQAFWTNYAGRAVSVCGTGAAYGIWQCADYNAGEEFVKIENPAEILPGDWIITSGGQWGHVAMAVGPYNFGYVAVYGENQGGTPCSEGGSQPNMINLSMKTFLGAFRPKTYIVQPEPEPVLAPDTGKAR